MTSIPMPVTDTVSVHTAGDMKLTIAITQGTKPKRKLSTGSL